MDALSWHLKQPHANGSINLYVVAECAGEMDGGEVVGARAKVFEQNANACGDGTLGELQFANIGLVEGDGRCDGEFFYAVGEAARSEDCASVEASGDSVDESAAADAARFGVSEDGV